MYRIDEGEIHGYKAEFAAAFESWQLRGTWKVVPRI
jgi:hypothetical protein